MHKVGIFLLFAWVLGERGSDPLQTYQCELTAITFDAGALGAVDGARPIVSVAATAELTGEEAIRAAFQLDERAEIPEYDALVSRTRMTAKPAQAIRFESVQEIPYEYPVAMDSGLVVETTQFDTVGLQAEFTLWDDPESDAILGRFAFSTSTPIESDNVHASAFAGSAFHTSAAIGKNHSLLVTQDSPDGKTLLWVLRILE